MMAAHARLAGLDVGTRSVTCSLGLRPVAQPAPFTSTEDSGPRTMNTDKTTIRTAKLRTVRSGRMLLKWSSQAYIAYADTNSECILPFFEKRMGYDIPNSELIKPRNEKLNEIVEARRQ